MEWKGSTGLPSRAFDYSFPLKINLVDWHQMPLHCTCLGKVLLANLNNEELKKYFKSKPFEKYTPNTIVDINDIKKNLSIVKREGIALDIEERNLGMSGIAAGVRNAEGETVGAIYVIGASIRLTQTVLKLITPSIKCCALKISRELGYRV